MPSLDSAVELVAGVEDAVEVVLVVHGPCDAVAEHAFGQTGQCVDWVLPQKGRCPARVSLGPVVCLWRPELVELVLGTRHGSVAIVLQLVYRALQQTPGTCVQCLVGVGVVEGDEEEGDVVLPGNAAERGQIRHGDQVAVAVLLVGHAEFAEVGLVVHVPAEDNTAETKAVFCNGQELLLGHELATQHAVHVDTGDLDCGIVLEQLWQRLDGYRLCFRHDVAVFGTEGRRALLKRLGQVEGVAERGGRAAEDNTSRFL